MKLKRVNNPDGELHGYRFDCPGCGRAHVIPTVGSKAWGFNGDVDAPTFTPSLLVRWRDSDGDVVTEHTCHSFIREGRIEFLGDCGHALAGRTVDLVEIVEVRS